MKETIAQAARTLLTQKGVKRLTVKDIVGECQITRQAFYYHFEDIPALFKWILQRETERVMQEARLIESGEERLKYLFVVTLNALPYVKKSMESGYRAEIEQYLTRYVHQMLERICDEEGLYRNCTRSEVRLIVRYHSQAIAGILRTWTEADSRELDDIVHTVFRLMTEGISPRG